MRPVFYHCDHKNRSWYTPATFQLRKIVNFKSCSNYAINKNNLTLIITPSYETNTHSLHLVIARHHFASH